MLERMSATASARRQRRRVDFAPGAGSRYARSPEFDVLLVTGTALRSDCALSQRTVRWDTTFVCKTFLARSAVSRQSTVQRILVYSARAPEHTIAIVDVVKRMISSVPHYSRTGPSSCTRRVLVATRTQSKNRSHISAFRRSGRLGCGVGLERADRGETSPSMSCTSMRIQRSALQSRYAPRMPRLWRAPRLRRVPRSG